MQKDVLILGGGVAGLQSALELAGAGYPVHLVTDEAALGGKLVNSQAVGNDPEACLWGSDQINISALYLGGNLHTSTTVLGSLITRAQNHPLISIYTGMKLTEFSGKAGDFQAAIQNVKNGQAKKQLHVGAVILAAGFSMFDASLKGEYGYGYYKNVLTSLDFENLLSTKRWTRAIPRPSDGKRAERIAFIQCVGSRDTVSCGEYCSAICCMFTAKEAILAKETDEKADVAVFYLDLRAGGKNFDDFLSRAQELGTRYVRTMISEVKEDPVTGNLKIRYVTDGQSREEEFDMVVLATGIRPAHNLPETAKMLGVALNQYGFIDTDPCFPVTTATQGIFSVGGSQGPMDVSETLAMANAAATASAAVLGKVEINGERPKRDVNRAVEGKEGQIAVFLCKSGLKTMGADGEAVEKYVRSMPNVCLVDCQSQLCQGDQITAMQKKIGDSGADRVVVAPCTMRTNIHLFQEGMQGAGINRMMVELGMIPGRELAGKEAANQAAKEVLCRAMANVKTYYPLHWHPEPVVQRALIVGGGITGMATSLSLADRGIPSTLVEKSGQLGGYVAEISGSLEMGENHGSLKEMRQAVEKNSLIDVVVEGEVIEFTGRQGNFHSKVSVGNGGSRKVMDINHGVVVLATGTTEYVPAEYLYGQNPKVISVTEAEYRLADGRLPEKANSTYAFIQCVGSRNEEHRYCSRTCCSQAVHSALRIKEKNPGANVYVFFRDMRTPGYLELFYREARNKGVIFVHYTEEEKPLVTVGSDGKLVMQAKDAASQRGLKISPDYVVLSSAQIASPDVRQLADVFRLQLNQDGFLTETHAGFGSIAFPGGGIHVAGAAHGPKSVADCLVQARGVANRAAKVLSQPFLMMGGIVAEVDPDKCAACLTCVRTCPYTIPKITREKKEMGAANIEAAECRGCGMCTAECPNKAIVLHRYTDQDVLQRIEALLTEVC